MITGIQSIWLVGIIIFLGACCTNNGGNSHKDKSGLASHSPLNISQQALAAHLGDITVTVEHCDGARLHDDMWDQLVRDAFTDETEWGADSPFIAEVSIHHNNAVQTMGQTGILAFCDDMYQAYGPNGQRVANALLYAER